MDERLVNRTILTVSQLTRLVRLTLEENFAEVWVEGEVSNLRSPTSGHLYFTLKDGESQLRAVIFKSAQRSLRLAPGDGLQVIARGRITVYEPRGEYQLVVDYLEPKGIGALQLAFEQLKERLWREGLFAEEHKRPLPLLPQRIGVVTSLSGAALRDILRIIDRRFANVHIVIHPVRVQGEGAAAEIAAAIAELNQRAELDVLIVGRGGGSIEDLWAFNEEVVARAIYHSRVPVISAVGHEIDYTIADFVADLRAPTPSAAAELVVQNKEEVAQRLAGWHQRLLQVVRGIIGLRRERLRSLASRRALGEPIFRLRQYQQRADELGLRLERAARTGLGQCRNGLGGLRRHLGLLSPLARIRACREHLAAAGHDLEQQMQRGCTARRRDLTALCGRLNALSPLAILGRGYSICRHLPSLAILRQAGAVQVGDQVSVQLLKGELRCGVEQVRAD